MLSSTPGGDNDAGNCCVAVDAGSCRDQCWCVNANDAEPANAGSCCDLAVLLLMLAVLLLMLAVAVINVGCVAVDAGSCCVNANDAEPANAGSCCDQCWCKCCS